MAPEIRRIHRHDDLVTRPRLDLVIATGAAVALRRLVRLNVTNLVRAVTDGVAHGEGSALPEWCESHAGTVAAPPTGSAGQMRDGGTTAMETLLVDRDNGVVTVTLNRPRKKNAINAVMWRELTTVFDEVANTPDDRVLVLTGAGDGFCSGADLTDASAADSVSGTGTALRQMRVVGNAAVSLHHLPKPTIAAVNGVAAGAGCNLALGCDLIVASEAASFTQIFVQRALTLDFGGSWLLPRLVGLHKAKELAFLGEIIDATQAAEYGFVNRVVRAEDLLPSVRELGARLATLPPVALSIMKMALNQSFALTLPQAVELEAVAQTVSFASTDTAEAIVAFIEKRPPRFTGA
jgi:enoyl-CoA hydratase/carnithine racemase